MKSNATNTCKNCGYIGAGTYCMECGESYNVKRITLHGLLHDVLHFFTHLEKGFLYTAKSLATSPGTMQRLYVNGIRSRHQKPFSMFFICATITALVRYWIFNILMKYYQRGNVVEADFFHHYMPILYALLIPFIALLTWAFFYKSGYNYAEAGVLQLYTLSFIFLATTVISLFKLIFVDLDTAYLELPVIIFYSSVTFVNFYHASNKWITLLKSMILMVILFFTAQFLEDVTISWMK